MRIKTQFIITMLLFSVLLVMIAVSAITTHLQLEKTSEQESFAWNIAQGASELSYLANEYLIYRENQQLKRWQSKFSSFAEQVADLNVDRLEQQALVHNIQANQKRLKEVFDSVISALGDPSPNKRTALDPAFLQVSWSRMAVQSQSLVSDASRLAQLLDRQMEQLSNTRAMLIYSMVGLFGLFLLASYMTTYRRILKSISTLQAGTAVIGSGDLDFHIKEKRRDEIGDLSHAFNQMTFNLKTVTASKSDLEREIAQRKQLEEDLRQQREWFRVTLSSIGDAVIASDTEGRITFLNPVAETLTGWQTDETLGQPVRNVFQIINEKTHTPAEDIIARVLDERRVVGLANDTALLTKDGREVPIEDSAAPILDAGGSITGVVLVFHDVTQKRRRQAELLKAHNQAAWLARFPDENPNPVIRASSDGSILYCNSASVQRHGWRCRVGQTLSDPLSPLLKQAMAEGKEMQQDLELGRRYYSVSVSPFPEEHYANVYGHDITERKQAEEALRESEQRLKRAQEISHLGGWELDLANNRLTWSDEVYRIFGLQPREFEATYEAFLQAVHPDDRAAVNAAYSDSLQEGRDSYEIEHRVVRKSTGETRFVHERCEHTREATGRVIRSVGMVQDITERKQAEGALWQRTLELQSLTETLEQRVLDRTAELAKANESLRQLSIRLLSAQEDERKKIACEIHDTLGACLGGIKFKVEDILQQMEKTPTARAQSLSAIIPVIQDGVEECRRIQMDLRPPMLDDLGLLVTLSWFCRRFENIYSGIRVEREVAVEESEIPTPLRIVIYRITQEAMNNIAKHSKANLVRLAVNKTDGGINLIIGDNGQGFKLDRELNAESTKRGLGLTSMRERTELSGGSFAIESIEGKGTKIRASWPI